MEQRTEINVNGRWTKEDQLVARILKGYGVSSISKMKLLGGQVITFWKQGNEMGGMPKGIFMDLKIGETILLDKIIDIEPDKEKRP